MPHQCTEVNNDNDTDNNNINRKQQQHQQHHHQQQQHKQRTLWSRVGVDVFRIVVYNFSISHRIRSKRQANEEVPQNYFNDQLGIYALGRHEYGSAFAVFFQNVSEFEV